MFPFHSCENVPIYEPQINAEPSARQVDPNSALKHDDPVQPVNEPAIKSISTSDDTN
jgi:hypothetical protein